ncbi:SusE domain-containing protein [Kaistella jeonii]|uniref:SusE outer membrane protein domain-containing protein n=1 Tax=Kaistella jeonii TaxID=266749 RepID=A0A0C1CX04_9FLAO|nr:SusE domain-containing protein [Kaistella jeonii]KIA88906.1 hypothetical protein OA86_09245 [Kaistella jeonii]
MKNKYIINAFYALLLIVGLTSCDDRDLVKADNSGAPIVMDLSSDHIFLDKNYPDNPALNVSWSQATYTVPVEVNYKIEASKDKDFKTPYVLGIVAQSIRTATYTVGQLNTAAQTIGLTKDVEGKMFLRVTSALGADKITAVSNVTSVNVTPYALEYPTFYLVGAASYVGWNSGVAQALYKKNNFSYIYTFMTPENFRFLGQQAWDPINYSIDNPGTDMIKRYFKQTSANIVFGDHENMKFTDPTKIYKIEINADGAVQSINATASALGFDYPNLYVVGTLNSWDAATALPMTKKPNVEGIYELTTNLGANSEMKFLGQKSFGDLEWGNILKDNNGNSGFIGPKNDDSNIVFNGNGGSYKITLNLKAGTYTIE